MVRKPRIALEPNITLVRFVLPGKNPDTGVKGGVFEAAYDLRRSGGLPKGEEDKLGELLRWFGDNLTLPTRFNRTKSKGHYRRTTKGVSWFKSSASEHVAKMHSMVSILKNHGYHVTMIKTRIPGYVVYEDSYQVVAEPFSDLRD